MNLLCFNGQFLPAGQPILVASNRSYRYGAGLFETIRVKEGEITLSAYHFERLFRSLSLLKFQQPAYFTKSKLEEEIRELCRRNNCETSARARLSVSAGNGYITEINPGLDYLIECDPLDEQADLLNKKGLSLGIYREVRKPADFLSNLKTTSALPYVMGAVHARENEWDDCIILNSAGNIADSTIANVFIIQENKIITPSLEEGCVDGVYRRYILDLRLQIADLGYQMVESAVEEPELLHAEEVFLTNAVRRIKWVARIGDKIYPCDQVKKIAKAVL